MADSQVERNYRLVHPDGTKDTEVERMTVDVAMASNRINSEINNPWRWEQLHESGCLESGEAVDCPYCSTF